MRAPGDFGRPDENGHSAVTLSFRDGNTKVSLDVLTFILSPEDEAGQSSAGGEGSRLSDEGMQADDPTVTQTEAADKNNHTSGSAVGKDGEISTDPTTEAFESHEYSPKTNFDQLTTDISTEDLQGDISELSHEIQADGAFLVFPDAAKTSEARKNEARQSTGGSRHSEPNAADHRFNSNEEEPDQDSLTAFESNSTSDSSRENIDDSNMLRTRSDTQLDNPTGDQGLGVFFKDPQSDSEELTTTLTSALRYLLGELFGPRSHSLTGFLPSREEATSREAKETDLRSLSHSIDSHEVDVSSDPALGSQMFQTLSPREEDDSDESIASSATPIKTISPTASPEIIVNPLMGKKGPSKSVSFGPVYISDDWPMVDLSNFLNDFSQHGAHGYEEWDYNSIRSHDTNTNHDSDKRRLQQESTPAWEDMDSQPELSPDSPPSSKVTSSSSETNSKTGLQLPTASVVSPTDAGSTLINNRESTEPEDSARGNGTATVSSSSEEMLDSAEERTLAAVEPNSEEIQNQTDTPDWPGQQFVRVPEGQQFSEVPGGPFHQEVTASKRHGKLVDLIPGSSSEEESGPISSTDTADAIPTSSEDQVSPENMGGRTQTLSGSSEDVNASLIPARQEPTLSGNSSPEDQELFSNEAASDSPGVSVELTPETASVLLQTIGRPEVSSESISGRDPLASDEDLSDEISAPDPTTGLQVTSGSSGGLTDSSLSAVADVNANANDANESPESLESQYLTSPTDLPLASSPSQAPYPEQSSEENNRWYGESATGRFHSNPVPAARPLEAAANPWTAFLQALKATGWREGHDYHKVQRPRVSMVSATTSTSITRATEDGK